MEDGEDREERLLEEIERLKSQLAMRIEHEEEALKRSEDRYRLVTENLHDVIWTMDLDLDLTYVSPSVELHRGYTAEETLRQGIEEILTPGSTERVLKVVGEVLQPILAGEADPHTSITVELEMTHKDGSTFWTETSISLLLDEGNRPTGILGVFRDITERRRDQERFLEEKRRAELYLDLFGHDIRNINQGIMSYLELILMRPELDPTEAGYINSVLVQATRINDLVAKVQRLTQLRTREIVIEDVDAHRLIQGAIDYVIAKYPDRTVQVATSDGCSDSTVKGSALLTDVFTSILDNAVRFNRNETVEVGIHCQPSEDGRSIRFMFDDRGPGITDDMKASVFQRLERPEVGIRGSGLGLTVVWEIIKRLDGRIWVEDRVQGEPSQGSRFVVEMPRGGGSDR